MNRISSIVFAWRRHVITLEEATERLRWFLDGANFVPEVEQIRERLPDSPMVSEFMKRIEQKLNILIQSEGPALPDELNSLILSEDVKELARENRKIEAVQMHRERTGAGLAEAKRVIDEFIRDAKAQS